MQVESWGRDPLAGTRYRALGRIGGGASSEVFEAVGPRGERCAVKLLREALGGTREARRRLEREGRALAALEHPNLVRVLDAGVTAAGRPFLVMPRLVGETARDRLRREGRLSPALAVPLVAGVLDGLDLAHRLGVIHRDVKPANLFVTARGKLLGPGGARLRGPTERGVLLDFGIAKMAGAGDDLTTGAHVIGTPKYLAPEQLLGGAIDARTDVYAAGLTLFELIAGRGPYDAATPLDAMYAHLNATPRRLAEFAEVSPAIAAVIARAIEKAPARRWPSARAFAAALGEAAR